MPYEVSGRMGVTYAATRPTIDMRVTSCSDGGDAAIIMNICLKYPWPKEGKLLHKGSRSGGGWCCGGRGGTSKMSAILANSQRFD